MSSNRRISADKGEVLGDFSWKPCTHTALKRLFGPEWKTTHLDALAPYSGAELLSVKGIGAVTLREIVTCLRDEGLHLGTPKPLTSGVTVILNILQDLAERLNQVETTQVRLKREVWVALERMNPLWVEVEQYRAVLQRVVEQARKCALEHAISHESDYECGVWETAQEILKAAGVPSVRCQAEYDYHCLYRPPANEKGTPPSAP